MSDLEDVVVEALQDSINENGEIDFHAAAPLVLQRIGVVATITVRTVANRDQYIPHNLAMSLTVLDPYDHVTPEFRSYFPLTDEMVKQNRRLLEHMLDSLVPENMRRRREDRDRTAPRKRWLEGSA